jgi:phage-related protein
MRAEVIVLLATLVFGIAGVVVFAEARKATLSKGFGNIIRPADLSGVHKLKELDDCIKCHEYTGEIKDEKCFDCHRLIKERLEGKIGYHGTREDPCFECHTEHPRADEEIIEFDEKEFDHDLAAYKLEGKHKDIECEDCHKKRKRTETEEGGYYVGIKFDLCTDCHKDPHKDELGGECEECHTLDGWTGKQLKFDHDKDSKYKLKGKHAKVKCEECHVPRPKTAELGTAQFRDMKFKLCTDCHKDPHDGQFKKDKCQPCHTIKTWKEKDLNFKHDKDSKYKLKDKHKDVKCKECHVPRPKDAELATAQFKEMQFKYCTGCHDDPHKDQFSTKECQPCHTMKTWKEKDLNFKHDKDSKYRLEGKHAKVKCAECHVPRPKTAELATAQFRKMKYKLCADCHKDPHEKVFGSDCLYCHNFKNWKRED